MFLVLSEKEQERRNMNCSRAYDFRVGDPLNLLGFIMTSWAIDPDLVYCPISAKQYNFRVVLHDLIRVRDEFLMRPVISTNNTNIYKHIDKCPCLRVIYK